MSSSEKKRSKTKQSLSSSQEFENQLNEWFNPVKQNLIEKFDAQQKKYETEVADLNKEIKDFEDKLSQKNKELSEATKEKKDAQKEHEAEVSDLKKKIKDFEDKLSQKNKELSEATKEKKDAQKEHEIEVSDLKKKTKSFDNELSKKNKELSKAQKKLHENETNQKKQDAEILELESKLDTRNSSLKMARKENENLEMKLKEKEEEVHISIISKISHSLSKLSVLSKKEPKEVHGMKIESVFYDLRETIEEITGQRLFPFPNTKKLEDDVIWLNAEEDGLEELIAKFDWNPEKPFMNLESGERYLPFQLVRRGWMIGDIVLKRAVVTPILMEETENE